MTTKTFEASSVDEALAQAAQEFGVDAADLKYDVEEKSEDFWGLGNTVYAVTVTAPATEAEPEVAETPEAPAEPEATEEPEEAVAPAEQAQPVAEEAPAPAEDAADSGEELPPFFSMDDSAPATEAVEEAEAAPEPAAEVAPDEAPTAETPVVEDTPEPAAAAPAGDDAPASGDGEDMTDEAVAILGRIFSAMGFECEAEAKLDGDTMHVAITGEDNQYLLEGRGRGLSALELILNHSFRAWPNRAHKRVRVDAGDFRSQRDDEIRDMAFQVAHRAKETGDEQQTAELNPYERRLVHLALADDSGVSTRSLGNGFLKAVNVIPTRQRN